MILSGLTPMSFVLDSMSTQYLHLQSQDVFKVLYLAFQYLIVFSQADFYNAVLAFSQSRS